MRTRRGLLHFRVHVPIGDKNIQQAIIVIIDEAAAETEHIACRLCDSGFIAYLIKETFAIVVPTGCEFCALDLGR